jgi:hypothetical protein
LREPITYVDQHAQLQGIGEEARSDGDLRLMATIGCRPSGALRPWRAAAPAAIKDVFAGIWPSTSID